MLAHVICCNDSVEAVSLATREETAKEQMYELARESWEKIKTNSPYDNYLEYREVFYWHIHTVEVL